MRLEVELDNGITEPPINPEGIIISIDNTPRGINSTGLLTIKNLIFAKAGADIINADKESALTG